MEGSQATMKGREGGRQEGEEGNEQGRQGWRELKAGRIG